ALGDEHGPLHLAVTHGSARVREIRQRGRDVALGGHVTWHAVLALERVDPVARQLTVQHGQTGDGAVVGPRDVAAATGLGDLGIVQLDRVPIDLWNAQARPGQRLEHQRLVQRARRGADADIVFADHVQTQTRVTFAV